MGMGMVGSSGLGGAGERVKGHTHAAGHWWYWREDHVTLTAALLTDDRCQ